MKTDEKIPLDISASTAVKLLGVLLLLTAFLGTFYIVYIPPWQSPDECTHFEYVHVLSRGGDLFHPRPDWELQKLIIRSMDRYGYWYHVGVEVPDPLPERFHRAPFAKNAFSQMHKNPPGYYLMASILLRLGNSQSLLARFYQLRILSLLFTLLTVVVAFSVAREASPGRPLFYLSVAAFTASLPQFLVIGTSVSPDPLINLIGSLIIWGVFKSLHPGSKQHLPALVILFTAIGFMVSYKFFMILPALSFSLPLAIWIRSSARGCRFRLVVILLGEMVVVVVAYHLLPASLISLYAQRLKLLFYPLKDFLTGQTVLPPGYWQWFNRNLFESTWLKFGHLRYVLPGMIYRILSVVTLICAAGTVWTMIKVAIGKKSELLKSNYLYVAVIFVLSVLGAYYCFWGIRYPVTTMQGRHFFIALPAGAILAVLGWGAFFPCRCRNLSYLVFATGMSVFNLLALFGYIRPVYA